MTKREAFQSLLQKLRAASNLSPTWAGGKSLVGFGFRPLGFELFPHFEQVIFGGTILWSVR